MNSCYSLWQGKSVNRFLVGTEKHQKTVVGLLAIYTLTCNFQESSFGHSLLPRRKKMLYIMPPTPSFEFSAHNVVKHVPEKMMPLIVNQVESLKLESLYCNYICQNYT